MSHILGAISTNSAAAPPAGQRVLPARGLAACTRSSSLQGGWRPLGSAAAGRISRRNTAGTPLRRAIRNDRPGRHYQRAAGFCKYSRKAAPAAYQRPALVGGTLLLCAALAPNACQGPRAANHRRRRHHCQSRQLRDLIGFNEHNPDEIIAVYHSQLSAFNMARKTVGQRPRRPS